MPGRKVKEPDGLYTAVEIGEIIVSVRLQLYNRAAPCGAKAIRKAMDSTCHVRPLPSLKTIAVTLAKHGLTHGRTGWYEGDEPGWLPESAKRWNPYQNVNAL